MYASQGACGKTGHPRAVVEHGIRESCSLQQVARQQGVGRKLEARVSSCYEGVNIVLSSMRVDA